MVFTGNFISSILGIAQFILQIYIWVIIARAVISWVSADPYNPIVRFIVEVTEPVLGRVRRFLPFGAMGGIDFSPVIVILGVMVLQAFLGSMQMQVDTWLR
ncbi:MAG: YggT family protein [Desulfofustis sp. PB-SRB1]|jgi:YggT family protein|nr:YggT family protein [Desulfofustis sp. PB-SRB1]MBM1003169.1 YggT family protein [Desulfofustis sp. PB-SRB1]HBH27422.1 YggT family protein [Desulfofustis sp.]HBH32801.1 YggT family protein [Desulfofustis sp.]